MSSFGFCEKIITQLPMLAVCRGTFLFCMWYWLSRKTFVGFVISNPYAVIWGDQGRIILAERRENGCLCPQWAVCFLSTEWMPGRPASLLCQSQAIRANGSTCLYVGRVWGLLFSGIGHFLFPSSCKSPALKTPALKTLFILSLMIEQPREVSPCPSSSGQRLKHFWGRVWTGSFPESI